MSQSQHIKKVTEWFGMDKAKLVSMSLAAHFKLSRKSSPKTMEKTKYVSRVPYAQVVESLMYTIVCTHPNITHVVSIVRRYMANRKEHWQANNGFCSISKVLHIYV